MTHRSALFAAVLGLGHAGSNLGDYLVQSYYCARVKGATDDKPVHYAASPDDEPTVHGTADGIKACAWHCLTYTAPRPSRSGPAPAPGHPAAPGRRRGRARPVPRHALRRGPPAPGGLLEMLATKTGKGDIWRLADHGLNGASCIDSAWHHGWETLAVLVATTKATTR
ncbi:hypothetical protein WDH52_24245 [Streptomyces sp. TRM70308]|uniref:hypothetical protein n=1 Tax=Streptomyces sp. TRM70308 TaxID=3131932 RepID=UPI003D02D8ED